MARRPTLKALKKAPGVADFENAVSSVAGSHFSDIPIRGDKGITSKVRVPRPTDPIRTREGPVPGEPNDSYLKRYNAAANKLVPDVLLPPGGEHHFEFRPTIGSKRHRLVPVAPGKGSRRSRTFGASPPRVVIRRVGDGHEMVLHDNVRGEYRPTFIWPIVEGRIGKGNWALRSK